MKQHDSVELWTYGTYDNLNDIDFGMSFEVPKKWLIAKIKDMGYGTLRDFFLDYTWDTTMTLNIEAECEGVLLNRKCGMFGHEIYKQDIRKINYEG